MTWLTARPVSRFGADKRHLGTCSQPVAPAVRFYVDHITDAIGTFFLMGGLALSGYMSPYIGLGLLIAYFLLSIEAYLTPTRWEPSTFPPGDSDRRSCACCSVPATSPSFFRPVVTLLGRQYFLFDVGGTIGIAGMGLMLVWSALRHTRALYDAERLP